MIRFCRRVIALGVIVYLTTLAVITAFSSLYANPIDPPAADVIVCLGAGVDAQGNLDLAASARALTCADLYAAGAAPRVHFTGGNDTPGAPSGGQAMANAAFAAGLPAAATSVEHHSRSTLQNALFSIPALTDAKSIVIVTDAFHLPRSALSFATMGPWKQTIWASERQRPNPFWGDDWHMLHRETLAFWFNILRFSAWRGATAMGIEDVDHWLI
ncbi:MAG: YdcF family protein [Pseudomonadota bacterium]